MWKQKDPFLFSVMQIIDPVLYSSALYPDSHTKINVRKLRVIQ